MRRHLCKQAEQALGQSWLQGLTAGIMCLPGMVKAALDAAQAEFKGHQTQQAQSAVVSRSDLAQTYQAGR